MRLNQKNVLITGAGSGIGRACSKLFYDEGANLILTDLEENGLMIQLKIFQKNRKLKRYVVMYLKKRKLKR